MDSSGSGYGVVVGSCEHSNKSSSSVKDGEFLDKMCATIGFSRMTLLDGVTSSY
jgi:hypothetical protein